MLVRKIWPEIPKCKKSFDSFIISRKQYKKETILALSTTLHFQIDRFGKLEKIMDDNNQLAPQGCFSASTHQVKRDKQKWELMSRRDKWADETMVNIN